MIVLRIRKRFSIKSKEHRHLIDLQGFRLIEKQINLEKSVIEIINIIIITKVHTKAEHINL